MALRLVREEGLFAGTTSGGNVVAAIKAGRLLGPGATVATLLVDSGLRYLATYGAMLADRIRRPDGRSAAGLTPAKA
jgi:cysteine synthase